MNVRNVALFASLTLVALAGVASAGTPGFAFLETPSGARASATGGAGVTLAEGAEAAFWNPAALDRAERLEIAGSHFEMYQALRHEDFVVAGPAFGGGIAASFRALYSEPIEERDDLGNLVGTFGAHDLEFALGYGARVANEVRVGLTGALVRERIADKAAQTWAVHTGLSWDPARWPGLRLAVAGQNLGPAGAFALDGVRGEDVALPAALQGGASYARTVATSWTLRGALETRLTRGRTGIGIVGAELSNPAGLAARAGVRLNDDVSSLAFGVGYRVSSLRLDYAYVPSRLDLEDTHRLSFAAHF